MPFFHFTPPTAPNTTETNKNIHNHVPQVFQNIWWWICENLSWSSTSDLLDEMFFRRANTPSFLANKTKNPQNAYTFGRWLKVGGFFVIIDIQTGWGYHTILFDGRFPPVEVGIVFPITGFYIYTLSIQTLKICRVQFETSGIGEFGEYIGFISETSGFTTIWRYLEFCWI